MKQLHAASRTRSKCQSADAKGKIFSKLKKEREKAIKRHEQEASKEETEEEEEKKRKEKNNKGRSKKQEAKERRSGSKLHEQEASKEETEEDQEEGEEEEDEAITRSKSHVRPLVSWCFGAARPSFGGLQAGIWSYSF